LFLETPMLHAPAAAAKVSQFNLSEILRQLYFILRCHMYELLKIFF
jgi:hypothetical protein